MAQATIWNPNTGQKQVITAGSAMPTGFSLWTGGNATGAQAQAAIKVPTPQPQSGQVAINGAQYNTGQLQKDNFTNITPVNGTLYGTPKIPSPITSSAMTGNNNFAAAKAQNQTYQLPDISQHAQPINDLITQIQATYNPTANETGLTGQYNDIGAQITNLDSSYSQGDNAIQDKVIPMEFITGQQASLQRGYLANRNSLVGQQGNVADRLKQEQATRQNQGTNLLNTFNLQDKLKSQQQDLLNNITTSLKGINPDKLTATQTAELTKLAEASGIPSSLLFGQLANAFHGEQSALDQKMIASGYTPIASPDQLNGLTEKDIIRLDGRIYAKGTDAKLDTAYKQAQINALNTPKENWVIDSASGKMYNKTTGEFKSTSTAGGIITSPSGAQYDMSTYNAPGGQAYIDSLQQIINSVGKLNNVSDLANYISTKMPNSKITANDVQQASAKTGVGWEEILGIIQKESPGGASNVAIKNNNFGGITASSTYMAAHPEASIGSARPVLEGGNYVKFATVADGLVAQAQQFAKRALSPKQQQDQEILSGLDSVDQGTWNNSSVEDRNIAKGLADYTLDISKVTSLKGNNRAKLANLASLINPNFDMNKYEQVKKTAASFAGGGTDNKNIKSLNTAINHLNELSHAATALNNRPNTWWNTIANGVSQVSGDSAVTNFNTAKNAVAGEMATIFKNTSGTDQEIKAWSNQISASNSPEQLKGAIDTMLNLMQGRLIASRDVYKSVIGKDPSFNFINGNARNILQDMGVDIESIDPLINSGTTLTTLNSDSNQSGGTLSSGLTYTIIKQ